MSNSFTWNQGKVQALKSNSIKGLIAMAFDVSSKAKDNAPWLSGDLSRSIRTAEENDVVYVLAGGKSQGKTIAYARRREYENNAHPETLYYMHRAFDEVVRGDYRRRYFGEATK